MSVVMRTQRAFSEENGRLPACANVRSCNCCPYGYHIDLDFVRYCEALANARPSEEELRRRSKRRSRKSMEVMLGMESIFDQFEADARVQTLPEATHESEPDSPYAAVSYSPYNQRPRSSSAPRFTYGGLTRAESPLGTGSSTCSSWRGAETDAPYPPMRPPANSPPETRAFLREALDDVCSDFERTLERASGRRRKAPTGGSPWLNGIGSDRNNNNTSKMHDNKELHNGYARPHYFDEFDSCVSGNKSPRNSRFYNSLPFQRKPSPAEQQYESYVQSKVVENAKSPVEQPLSPLTPTPPSPPQPPPRLVPAQTLTSPISTSTDGDGPSLLGEQSPDAASTLLSPQSATDGAAAAETQTLYNIRQQMALSLRRMKDLEEQVKSIPEMQHELSELRGEKQRLQQSLQRKEEELLRARDTTRPSATPSPVTSLKNSSPVQFTPQRISPISLESLGSRLHSNASPVEKQSKLQSLAVLKREVGTMCGRHNTRDIAVGSPVIMLHTVGTSPLQTLHISELLYTRLELDERISVAISCYEEQRQLQQLKKLISVGTQMYVPAKQLRESGAQTSPDKVVLKYAVGVMAKPTTRENFVNCRPDVRTVGVSEHSILDVLCEKCAVLKRTVACGTDQPPAVEEKAKAAALKQLEMPARSNTFSLGDNEKLNIARKTIGTQYVPLAVHSAGSQTSAAAVRTVGMQFSPEVQNVGTQNHIECSHRQTDTRDLIRLCATQTSTEEIATPEPAAPEPAPLPPPKPATRNTGSNTEPPKLKAIGVNTLPPANTRHSASNTEQVRKRDIACGDIVKPHISIACADNYCDSCKEAIKHLAKDFSKRSTPPSPLPTRAPDSRIPCAIPRPKHITSPSPVRKQFQRQNTYTITTSPTPTPSPVAEKEDPISSLQEKPPSPASFHQLECASEAQSFITEPTSQQNVTDAAAIRRVTSTQVSQQATVEEQEAALPKEGESQTPQDTQKDELTQAFEGDLIVREEKRVSISWSRDASPVPPKSLETSYNEQLKECSEPETEASDVTVVLDAPKGGARKKTTALLKTSRTQDALKQQREEAEQQEQQQKPPSKALLQKLAMEQTQPRTKIMPPEEMLCALKIINNSLLKKMGAKPLSSHSLKAAKTTIQHEWFRISSTEQANPHEIEDYLDCFEELSVSLLDYCVNMGDANGNTAMHYAVSHGNFDVVSILLDSKVCNVNQLNNAGYTCIMLVSLAKLKNAAHRTVVQRLFQMADVNIRAKKHCQTALMLAVSHGNGDMVELLLAAGADINIQDEDGSSALMCAAEHGRADIVKHLLTHAECDSLLQDVDGSTAFKIAWQAGHRDIGLLIYMHEQMLRNKMPNRGEPSASSKPVTSPRPLKKEPPK